MRKIDGVEVTIKKREEVRVDLEKKTNWVRVDHEKKRDRVRAHHEKVDGVRVQDEEERWGMSLP